MTTFTESMHAGEFIVSEANGTRARETATLITGQDLEAGTVLGRITKGTAAGAAVAGNTGNGTITAAPTVGAAAKPGVYRLTCIATATNGGKFMVQDPDGIALPNAAVAAEYTTHLTFTIADGATDFALGDSFTITVAAGSGKLTQFDQDGTDGSETAVAILIYATDAASADQTCVVLVRDAEVNGAELTWPSDIETAEQTVAIAQLAALGLIVR